MHEHAPVMSKESAPPNPCVHPAAGGQFQIAPRHTARYEILKARIRGGFGSHFNACISGFMPDLAAYRHVGGSGGVIGIRGAGGEKLFLESYLDQPVEDVIALVSDAPVHRRHVVEVGQFVIDERAAVGDFFRDLVPFLRSLGYEWVCFTGTRRIRTLLASIGFAGFSIACASRERITDTTDDWGTYYEHEPEVILGKLSDPRGSWFRRSGNAG